METENLFDKDAKDTANGYVLNEYLRSDGSFSYSTNYYISEYIPIQANETYTFTAEASANTPCICFYDAQKNVISGESYAERSSFTITSPVDTIYARLSVRNNYAGSIMFTKGSTDPPSYIPFGYKIPISLESSEQTQELAVYIGDSKLSATEYVDYESGKIYKLQEGVLTPTDPPLPFPTITVSEETTITTTETLGDVEFTGDWLAIMGSTEAESIDIGFTVDADEFIAFVTVDDDPQIQVTDTITMPSSAGCFTLQVVSWGREQYTETVYSALS